MVLIFVRSGLEIEDTNGHFTLENAIQYAIQSKKVEVKETAFQTYRRKGEFFLNAGQTKTFL